MRSRFDLPDPEREMTPVDTMACPKTTEQQSKKVTAWAKLRIVFDCGGDMFPKGKKLPPAIQLEGMCRDACTPFGEIISTDADFPGKQVFIEFGHPDQATAAAQALNQTEIFGLGRVRALECTTQMMEGAIADRDQHKPKRLEFRRTGSEPNDRTPSKNDSRTPTRPSMLLRGRQLEVAGRGGASNSRSRSRGRRRDRSV